MKHPRNAPGDENRKLELEEELDTTVAELLAEVNVAGYSIAETLDALDSVLRTQRRVYEEDPDPAGDPS